MEQTLEEEFREAKPLLADSEAQREANRCLNCFNAPCIQACPTHINIPQFINRIATENTVGAAKTILDSNILGQSCAMACPTEVLCEGACVYHALDQKPILIGKLQRYAVDYAYQRGISFYQPAPSTGYRVALVGSGPASLACAHELRKNGHSTHIFEKATAPGGLNTHGIAPYKMKASTSLQEIQEILKIGIEIQFGMELGRNVQLKDLIETYDAIFLGLGLGPDSFIPPADLKHPRILGAVQWISELKTTPASQMDWMRSVRTALVIGGGNTALDACRELKSVGVPKVIVSYRRTEKEMSGYLHELNRAKQEGVEFWFKTLPTHLEAVSPSQLKATLQTTIGSKNQGIELGNEKIEIPVDLVLVATGQNKLEKIFSHTPELRFVKGCLLVDAKTGQTTHPKIFAGGDLVNGGMEVVNAVAEGKRAALAIHQEFLNQRLKADESLAKG